MSDSWDHGAVRNALLSAAREHSSVEELKCHALFDLLETCHELSQTLRRELARNALTESGFRLLAHVIHSHAGAVDPQILPDSVGLSPKSVSAILGRLEVSGLVARERMRGTTRAFAVAVTPAGRTAFSSALAGYLEAIKRMMSVLDTADITRLDQACIRLRQFSNQTCKS